MVRSAVEILTSPAGMAPLVGGGVAHVTEIALAPLRVASGRLAVCDPFAPSSIATLPISIVPADYIIKLTLATNDEGDTMVAFAALSVPLESLTLPPGVENDSRALQSPYPVDTGLGCFLDDGYRDAWIAQAYSERCDLDDTLKRVAQWRWGTGLKDGAASHLVAFSTGDGDGVFDTLLLRAQSHWIIATDFQVIAIHEDT